MIRRLHVAAALTAFLTILTFWLSTISVELLGTETQIAFIKQAIATGFVPLGAGPWRRRSDRRVHGSRFDRPRNPCEEAPHAIHRSQRSSHPGPCRHLPGPPRLARGLRHHVRHRAIDRARLWAGQPHPHVAQHPRRHAPRRARRGEAKRQPGPDAAPGGGVRPNARKPK